MFNIGVILVIRCKLPVKKKTKLDASSINRNNYICKKIWIKSLNRNLNDKNEPHFVPTQQLQARRALGK